MTHSDALHTWQLVQWSGDNGMALDRASHTATAVGSKLYIFGGRKGSLFYNDILCFDTRTSQWSRPAAKCPFKPRGGHSATLIGNTIWFIGGCDDNEVLGDIFTLELTHMTWHNAMVLDPNKLLTRCAHAAAVHPRSPHTIVIMGGYAAALSTNSVLDQQPYTMNSDLLLLHTESGAVERVVSFNSVPPTPRGYHTMSIVGDKAYIFGGRTLQRPGGQLAVLNDSTLLTVYDLMNNSWITPTNICGAGPCPRSSHSAVVYHGRIIIYGGAVDKGDGGGEGEAKKERLNDVYTLSFLQGGQQLCWTPCDSPQASENAPQGLSSKHYARECWKLPLKHDAFERWRPSSSTARITPAAVLQGGTKRPAEGDRRSPQVSTNAGAGHGSGGGGSGAGAAAASGDPGGWRTAKRQRSGPGAAGGSGAAHQRQQQQQQWRPSPAQPRQQQQQPSPLQQQQQQQPQQGQPSPLQQQYHQQQQQPQPFGEVLQTGQQQQQQCLHPQTLQQAAAAMAAAALAAANGGATFVANSCPASPSRMEIHQQQELEQIREQLRQQCSRTSCLEGENRQLRQQLLELKQDKQAADATLQSLQADTMRSKLAVEQANAKQIRDAEAVRLKEQELESVKQAKAKIEAERDQLRPQVDSLNAELRRLQGQLPDLERDKRSLQEQLAQQQEKERSSDEKHAAERQQQQQSIMQMQASLEQHNNELRRLNDTMAEEKRKHESIANSFRADVANKDMQLQEKARMLLDLQAQLDSTKAALGEEQKRAESFRSLQATTSQQLEALRQSHNAQSTEKARLEAEAAKWREENDRLKAELGAAVTKLNTVRTAVLQLDGLHATLKSALGTQ